MAEITDQMVTYPANGSETTGYLARPEGDGPFPGVVVIQEWWGLNDDIKDIARRFANEGYAALAPDLYHGTVAGEPDTAMQLARSLAWENALKDLSATVRYLKSQPFSSGKVGAVGYCMGGGLAFRLACNTNDLDAVNVYYGRTPPEDEVRNLSCPVLGIYGGADRGIPPEAVRDTERLLEQHGKQCETMIYPDAPHSFFNAGEAHRPEAAADAWQRTLAFFGQHLR
jgi:carboxymethylenebutenolidase